MRQKSFGRIQSNEVNERVVFVIIMRMFYAKMEPGNMSYQREMLQECVRFFVVETRLLNNFAVKCHNIPNENKKEHL